MTFDILVNLIPHRLAKFTNLLDVLEPQIVPGVRVLVAYDNLETPWTAKCNALQDAATADYVAHIDDDDLVAEDYVSQILQAISKKPDYVGFKVLWTQDGWPRLPVIHSLVCAGWQDTPERLLRDITDKNPLRRDLALLARWEGGNGADRTWADQLRGNVKTEEFIDKELYFYREETDDTYLTGRIPFVSPPVPPKRPWVTYI